MRENVEDKGRRLLTEGRITVRLAGTGQHNALIVAQARGDSGEVYDLGFDPGKWQWRCTCPAKGKCSHLVALQLVTLAPKRTGQA